VRRTIALSSTIRTVFATVMPRIVVALHCAFGRVLYGEDRNNQGFCAAGFARHAARVSYGPHLCYPLEWLIA